MTGAFALAGWHFSRNPTSSSSENTVAKVHGSEPWNTGSDARYQYHPGGDPSKGKKDAPSALNEVIVPNVNLPKVSEIHRNVMMVREMCRASGSLYTHRLLCNLVITISNKILKGLLLKAVLCRESSQAKVQSKYEDLQSD